MPTCLIHYHIYLHLVLFSSLLAVSYLHIVSAHINLSTPATRASLGQRLNQSMVHPEMRAGNFNALLRNFSPTGEKHRTTCRFCLTRLIKKSRRLSLVEGRRGNSRFMTGSRSLRISSISSRAKRLDTCREHHVSWVTSCKSLGLCICQSQWRMFNESSGFLPAWLSKEVMDSVPVSPNGKSRGGVGSVPLRPSWRWVESVSPSVSRKEEK